MVFGLSNCMEPQEDTDLIARCKAGARDAFDELVLKYHKKVFNLAYRMLSNYDEANDLAQEVFVRVFHSIKKFRGESSIFTWLYRITVNLSKNRLKVLAREQRRMRSLDDPISTQEGEIRREIPENKPLPAQILVNQEKTELIEAALGSLEDEFRVIVVLRDIEGLSYKDIGQILKVNIGTLKSRLHRGRMKLKDKLGSFAR